MWVVNELYTRDTYVHTLLLKKNTKTAKKKNIFYFYVFLIFVKCFMFFFFSVANNKLEKFIFIFKPSAIYQK